MNEWTQEKEAKILKRSKWLLTIKIVRIIIIIAFIYWIYMLAITLISDATDTKNEDAYYARVATSMKYPNVYADFTSILGSSIRATGTQQFSNPLLKVVGKEETLIGDVKVTKSLLNVFSHIQYEHPGRAVLNEFSFVLPNDANKYEDAEDESSQTVWQRLEKLPEGTVAEMKFTTVDYMTPEALLKKVANYDLDVLWMPLFTGEFESFTPTSYGSSGNGNTVSDKIGLYGGHAHGKDFNGGSFIHTLNLEMMDESKDYYLTNLKEMLDKKESYYERFLGLSYLEERYEYIQSNGFEVYGAVVTGPTKELLKLRAENGIYQFQLGDVELWNWK